ncbi:MAG: dipeptide ABC transporter ATP-binding protein [Nitrospinae bacterium]|jgi:oligopeptide transport system ATP-binding protein|nr:dipeptide ABC transporter ATP-binding protein [Nitrospinota bacterium]MDA1109777.1 dipeptide ABC transporter ATP-binding protein [Nitrospinota bacterium]
MNLTAEKHHLLEVKNLKKHFEVRGSFLKKNASNVRAVDGISFVLKEGETLGLVGESGCGKSTAARAILRLVEPTSGEILYKGTDLLRLCHKEMQPLRREMQIIFQDPNASLNPRRRVGSILEEPFEIHDVGQKEDREDRVAQLLQKVGLSPEHARRFPHEFSGGQLQRIGIARAIALNPRLIVADEPVSSLDVSIQAQVINLMQDLKETMNISYLFISHDMAIVEHFCDRVAVMYLGKIVEMTISDQLYNNPRHPYTEALLSVIPTIESGRKKQPLLIKGDIPSAANPPTGCAFHTRCPIKEKICETTTPELKEVEPGHFVACLLRES